MLGLLKNRFIKVKTKSGRVYAGYLAKLTPSQLVLLRWDKVSVLDRGVIDAVWIKKERSEALGNHKKQYPALLIGATVTFTITYVYRPLLTPQR